MKNIISRPSKQADVEDLLWARAAPGPEEFAGLESRERASLVNVLDRAEVLDSTAR
jgi:hypothetical protein